MLRVHVSVCIPTCMSMCMQPTRVQIFDCSMADGTGPLPSLTRNALCTLDGSVACVLSIGMTKMTSLLSSKGELVREQFVLLSFCEIMLDTCSLTPCCRTLSTPEVANSGTVLIPACHLDKKGLHVWMAVVWTKQDNTTRAFTADHERLPINKKMQDQFVVCLHNAM